MNKSDKSPAGLRRSIGTRKQQVFAFIGLVLFLTGLVATALFGQFNLITAALCVIGIIVGSVIFLPRFNRNLSVYANMTLYSVFFCAAAIVFFIILQKHPLTYDATSSHNFSLSTITSNFLERLDQPIRATAFVRNKQDRNSASLLLGEYSRYSPQFDYRIVDPFLEPNIAAKYGAEVLPGDVYLDRMSTGTAKSDRTVKVTKLAEEQLTNGIMQLLRGRDLNLYFTTGHGEPPMEADKVAAALTGEGANPDNLQMLTDQLKRNYIRAVPLELDRRQTVPSDASAVVIVRPRVDFTTVELRALSAYLQSGGRVMFMLGPNVLQIGNEVRTSIPGIVALVKQFGIELPPDIVVMPLNQQAQQSIYTVPVLPRKHRITEGAVPDNPVVLFEQARPVLKGTAPPNTFLDTFLVSDDKAWPFPIEELETALRTRTNPDVAPKMDDLTAIPLGIAATKVKPEKGEKATARIVVVGNGSFLTSRYLTNPGWLLFMNGVNWVTDSGELIAIPSAEIENTPSNLTPGQRRFLFILVVIAMPALIALGGLGYSITKRGGSMQ